MERTLLQLTSYELNENTTCSIYMVGTEMLTMVADWAGHMHIC